MPLLKRPGSSSRGALPVFCMTSSLALQFRGLATQQCLHMTNQSILPSMGRRSDSHPSVFLNRDCEETLVRSTYELQTPSPPGTVGRGLPIQSALPGLPKQSALLVQHTSIVKVSVTGSETEQRFSVRQPAFFNST